MSSEPDIILTPTNPISAHYYSIEGRTPAGKAFVETLYPTCKVRSGGQPMQRFKEEAADQGLTFDTDWSCVVSQDVDP